MSIEVREGKDPVAEALAEVQPGQTAVSEEQAAMQEGGSSSLAARMQARAAQLKARTKPMEVPPHDVWSGELVAVMKAVPIKHGQTFASLIVEATDHLMAYDPDAGDFRREEDGTFTADSTGSWRRLSGWGEIGELMGLVGDRVTLGQIVTAVCGSEDVLGGFAETVIAFIMGRQSAIERFLGE